MGSRVTVPSGMLSVTQTDQHSSFKLPGRVFLGRISLRLRLRNLKLCQLESTKKRSKHKIISGQKLNSSTSKVQRIMDNSAIHSSSAKGHESLALWQMLCVFEGPSLNKGGTRHGTAAWFRTFHSITGPSMTLVFSMSWIYIRTSYAHYQSGCTMIGTLLLCRWDRHGGRNQALPDQNCTWRRWKVTRPGGPGEVTQLYYNTYMIIYVHIYIYAYICAYIYICI